MAQSDDQPGAGDVFGDLAPYLVHLSDSVLLGEVWERPELAPRDRSLITIASLMTSGSADSLGYHLQRALDNGLTRAEIVEAITHLAFYAGWPRAMTAMNVAKDVLPAAGDLSTQDR